MADRELIAATIVAGMLPTVAAPGGQLSQKDEVRIHEVVAHAVALYRAVLDALTVEPTAH